MITAYILVLCLSTWLFAYGMNYVGLRMGHVLKRPGLLPAGISLLTPILLFLVVVGANPAMLIACILLAAARLTPRGDYLPPIAQIGLPVIASLIALSSMQFAPLATLPPVLIDLLALAIVAFLVLSAEWLNPSLAQGGTGLSLAFLPLLAAPFMGAPSFIALDIAIIMSSMLAAQMVADRTSSLRLARQPLVLMLGWLIVESARQGAWVPAGASLLVYAAALLYSRLKPTSHELAHAF